MRIDYHGVVLDSRTLIPEMEPEEVALVCEYVRPNDRVVQAGTGMGFLAAVCQTIAPTATYEPQIGLIDIVRPRVLVRGLPLAIHHGAIAGEVTENDNGWWATTPGPDAPRYTLDELIERHHATALVLDIEGAEVEALKAMTARPRLIIVEGHLTRVPVFEIHRALAADYHEDRRIVRYWKTSMVNGDDTPLPYLLYSVFLRR